MATLHSGLLDRWSFRPVTVFSLQQQKQHCTSVVRTPAEARDIAVASAAACLILKAVLCCWAAAALAAAKPASRA